MPRPPRFDRSQVLDQSMQLFWAQGYAATSVQQLGERMDMRPGSLYAAFHDKKTLFLETLDHYFEQSSRLMQERLLPRPRAIDGLHHFFDRLIDDLSQPSASRGCLMINTANEMAATDPLLRERLKSMFDSHEARLKQVLELAQAEGDLPGDEDPAALARFLLMGVRGLKTWAQTGAEKEALQDMTHRLLKTLEA